MDTFEATDNCIELINNNVGFVTVGWYKREQITDKSLIAARNANGVNGGKITVNGQNNKNQKDMYVTSGDTSYHIVKILPT